MCIPIFAINDTSTMFLTMIKTIKFTVACPGNICIVYIITNKQKIQLLQRMTIPLEILLLTISMCCFQEKFSSMNMLDILLHAPFLYVYFQLEGQVRSVEVTAFLREDETTTTFHIHASKKVCHCFHGIELNLYHQQT